MRRQARSKFSCFTLKPVFFSREIDRAEIAISAKNVFSQRTKLFLKYVGFVNFLDQAAEQPT